MKVITLNTWGARIKEPFCEFILASKDIDIFCFQEIYDKAREVMKDHYPDTHHDLYTELKLLMPEYNSYFRPALRGVYGLATFIKKNIKVVEEGEILIHKNPGEPEMSGHHDRNLEWIKIETESGSGNVLNVHGLWNGNGKSDTPPRITQSERIIEFMSNLKGPTILCGDFNLLPDTESVKMIESSGMRNLIKEYGVTSTRTELYTKEIKYADYIFVSKDMRVNDFKVLPHVISDHSPLMLDFNFNETNKN